MHCEAQSSHYYSGIEVDGVRMRDALAKWRHDPVTTPASNHTYLPCHLKEGDVSDRRCNPTCRGPGLDLYIYPLIVSAACLVLGGIAYFLFIRRHFFAFVVASFPLLSFSLLCPSRGHPHVPQDETVELRVWSSLFSERGAEAAATVVKGSPVDVKDIQGLTPFDFAAHESHAEVCKFLRAVVEERNNAPRSD